MSEDSAERGSADVLGHLDQVAESVLGQPVRPSAGHGAHDVLAVPKKNIEILFMPSRKVFFKANDDLLITNKL